MSPRPASPHSPARALTVTELNSRVHDFLEGAFAEVWVEGEVSDPRPYPSGHVYFTLKDEQSQLSAVMFRSDSARLRFSLEHGLLVLARGRVSTYLKRGQVQLVVSEVEPKAAGALQLAFEQLKKRLEAEGLFAPERKKALPPFPERIGIVTSLQGAALRDMLSVLRRRFEGLHIRILPVPVQGAEAAPRIAEALEDFNAHFPDTQVLLVGRGGGSLEDLWPFNEEAVARAIAASRIPVVSCVGHETDTTISDFAADLRAPTPSAAAELVVQDRASLRERIEGLRERLLLGAQGVFRSLSERLRSARSSPALRDPRRIFEQRAQRVDELLSRLPLGLRGLCARMEERLARLGSERLAALFNQVTLHAEKDLRLQRERLNALSPLRVLSRGYAIVTGQDGRIVRSPAQVRAGEPLRVQVEKGEFDAEVK